MANVKFIIKVPNWLYRFRYDNIKNYLAYHWKPYRCSECNTKMPFGYFDIWADAKYPLKQRLGIAYHGQGKMCPSCLKKRIQKLVASKDFARLQKQYEYDYNVKKVCAVCGEDKLAFKFIYFDDRKKGGNDRLHFCTTSWNHDHVCLDCINTALDFGEMRSSIYRQYKGKSVPSNGYGLPVVNGKVRFPE